MKKHFQTFSALVLLTLIMAACTSPVVGGTQPSSSDQVATVVVMTLKALTHPVETGQTPEPEAPADALLPHTFYFLDTDNAGLTQVFRIERDGSTQKQLTFEPVSVKDYDVSLADGSVAYVAGNQLLLVNADGSDRRLVVDGGAVDENNPFLSMINSPVFSPNGQTLAYGYKGLNLYSVSSGVFDLVIEELHRGLKQLTGTEKCQCRNGRSQRNHIACCYHAWLSLKVKAKSLGKTLYQTKENLLSDYLRTELASPRIQAFLPA